MPDIDKGLIGGVIAALPLDKMITNGASDLLHEILGAAGAHTRTSVGVMQLPKSAAVEVDMIAVAHG